MTVEIPLNKADVYMERIWIDTKSARSAIFNYISCRLLTHTYTRAHINNLITFMASKIKELIDLELCVYKDKLHAKIP